jgi:hypothetical protein
MDDPRHQYRQTLMSQAVRFDLVVLLTVVAHNHPRYRQPQRSHLIQTLITEPSADTIHNPVLPQAHWLIMIRLDLILLEPRLHNRGNKYLTVIAARMLLYPMVLLIATTSTVSVQDMRRRIARIKPTPAPTNPNEDGSGTALMLTVRSFKSISAPEPLAMRTALKG